MTRIEIQREGANFSSIPPVRHEFHWLPVQARMHFKILLLAFKAIHGLASSYISDLLAFKKQVPLQSYIQLGHFITATHG